MVGVVDASLSPHRLRFLGSTGAAGAEEPLDAPGSLSLSPQRECRFLFAAAAAPSADEAAVEAESLSGVLPFTEPSTWEICPLVVESSADDGEVEEPVEATECAGSLEAAAAEEAEGGGAEDEGEKEDGDDCGCCEAESTDAECCD